jgi:8-amino-7-oxononanoate synthase
VGYLANLGAISAVCGKADLVLLDRAAHASLVDGCRLAGVRTQRFRHNDLAHLERLLRAEPERAALVAVDGVYSMEGDLAPLPDLVEVCRRNGARLLVDDAHGLGVFGRTGRGVPEHFGVEREIDLLVGTFSKSLGTVGGFVAGDAVVIDFVRHLARPFLFTASLPAPVAAATRVALRLVLEEPERRERLWRNTHRLWAGLRERGFDQGRSESPIVPVRIGNQARTFAIWKRLTAMGVYVNPVLPPAVPPGHCILRVALMATRAEAHVARLLAALEEAAAAES